jgi:uncharacterized protein (TIGR02448 family)
LSKTLLLTALLLASAGVANATDNPFAFTTRVVFRILFMPTASVLSTGFTSVTTTAVAEEQKVLALAALEDAAHFVDSGQLRGVLPMVMQRLRELDPAAQLASVPDAELVDAVIASAEQALEQVEAYHRAAGVAQ